MIPSDSSAPVRHTIAAASHAPAHTASHAASHAASHRLQSGRLMPSLPVPAAIALRAVRPLSRNIPKVAGAIGATHPTGFGPALHVLHDRLPGLLRTENRVNLPGGAGAAAKLGRGAAVVGAAVAGYDVYRTWRSERSFGPRTQQATGRGVGGVAGALAGAKVGGLVGATIGTAIPVVGTAVGGLIGATAGAIIGGFAGSWIGEHSAAPVADALSGVGQLASSAAHDISHAASSLGHAISGLLG